MDPKTWTVTQARSKLRDVINKAQSLGPQTITRNGRKIAMVVAADQGERKTRRRGTLAEFFARSPLRRSGLMIRRHPGRLPKVGL